MFIRTIIFHEAELLYWNAKTYSRELLSDVFYEFSDLVTPSLIHAIKMLNRNKDESLARRLHDLAKNYER